MGNTNSNDDSYKSTQELVPEEVETNPNPSINEGFLENKETKENNVVWYKKLIYDMKWRILYAFILAIALGFGIPLLLNVLIEEEPPYRNCLLQEEYRFPCFVRGKIPRNETECLDSFCCYDGNASLPFNCYHSYTSAYRYSVSSSSVKDNENVPTTSTVDLVLEPVPFDKSNTSERISQMTTLLKVHIEWLNDEHFVISFVQIDDGPRNDSSLIPQVSKKHENGKAVGGRGDVEVFVSVASIFFIYVKRRSTNEVIFDTRLGPLISNDNSLQFTTVLPTQNFLGLEGGQGSEISYGINAVNAPEILEFPFYMAFEKNKGTHAVLVETSHVFIAQKIEAPALALDFEASGKESSISIALNFFIGPTPSDVQRQLQTYRLKEFHMPPYWALGLNLCRKGYNSSEVLHQLERLKGDQTSLRFPYDSDCIDEDVRTPFKLHSENFLPGSEEFRKILETLEQMEVRDIFLTQKTVLKYEDLFNEPELPPLVFEGSQDTPLIGGWDDGIEGNEPIDIVYLDYLDPKTSSYVNEKLDTFDSWLPSNLKISAFILVDNYPVTNNITEMECSILQINGIIRSNVSESIQKNASGLELIFYENDLICPDAIHYQDKLHFDVHQSYGQDTIKIYKNAYENVLPNNGKRFPIFGVSTWTKGQAYEGFSGVEASFTWEGLKASLSHFLRYSVFNGGWLSGIPICGSIRDSETDASDKENLDEDEIYGNEQLLCLRWFQIGLLLPFARNTNKLRERILGPENLSVKYKMYIKNAVQRRYALLPYFYTLYYEFISKPQPIVRSLAYDFPATSVFNQSEEAISQFMIGSALMVAPIVNDKRIQQIYFPEGTWYDLHGTMVINENRTERTYPFATILSEVPIFFRPGHIVPMIYDTSESLSALGSRKGMYSLVTSFPKNTSNIATGSLFIDDGISTDSISNGNYDYLKFESGFEYLKITRERCSGTLDGVSRVFKFIRIFDFPSMNLEDFELYNDAQLRVSCNIGTVDEETPSLQITIESIFNWCENAVVTFSWDFQSSTNSTKNNGIKCNTFT